MPLQFVQVKTDIIEIMSDIGQKQVFDMPLILLFVKMFNLISFRLLRNFRLYRQLATRRTGKELAFDFSIKLIAYRFKNISTKIVSIPCS